MNAVSSFQRLFRPVLSVGFGNGFLQACGLLTNVVLIRIFTTEEYGGFAIINSTIALAGLVFSAGFSLATTRTVAALADDQVRISRVMNYLYRITAMLGGIAGLVIVVFSGPICEHIFGHAELWLPLALSALLVFSNILNGIQVGALQGLQAFSLLNIANIWRGFLQLIFVSVGAYVAGLPGAFVAFSVAGLVACLINSRQIRTVVCVRGAGYATGEEMRAAGFFPIAKSALGSQLTGVPVPWVINLLLLRSAGGLVEVAYLNVARQLVQAATFVPEVISQVTLPRLTNAFAKDAMAEFCQTVRATAAIQFLFVSGAGVGFLLLGGIIGNIFQIQEDRVVTLLSLVVLQAILTVLSMPYGAILWATGDGRKAFLFALLRSIASVIAVWLFRDEGAGGVLLAICIVLTGQLLFVVIPQSHRYFRPHNFPIEQRLGKPR